MATEDICANQVIGKFFVMGLDLLSSRTLMTLGGLRAPAEARLLHLTLTMPWRADSGGIVGRNAAAGALCRVTAGLEPALGVRFTVVRGPLGLICCSVTTRS
jgi:hypothetical protein